MTKKELGELSIHLFKAAWPYTVQTRNPGKVEPALVQEVAEQCCMAALKLDQELKAQDLVDQVPA